MDAGALELHLRRLPGVVACQLTATEAVLLLGSGDPAAVRVAAQAALDQAGSDRRIRMLSAAPAAPPVAVWRRRRFAVLAGAAGALSAGIAAASTLASMPGAVSPAQDVAISVPETESPAGREGVRTLVPAPAGASPDVALPVEAGIADAEALADVTLAGAPASPLASSLAGSPVADAPAPPAPPAPPTLLAPASPPPAALSAPVPAPAPAVTPEPGVVSAASDDDDRSRGRGRDARPPHPHGEPPGYLQRAGHGPW